MAAQPDILPPLGAYSVSVVGHTLNPGDIVGPGTLALVTVLTLCGTEEVRIECVTPHRTTAAELARRVQLVASVQHPRRRACSACLDQFSRITRHERTLLYASDPGAGAILGLDGAEVIGG